MKVGPPSSLPPVCKLQVVNIDLADIQPSASRHDIMILSCCFGNNKKQKKEDAGNTSLQEYDAEVSVPGLQSTQLSGIAAIISE